MKEAASDHQRLQHMLKAANRLLAEYAALKTEVIDDGDVRYWGFVKLVEIIGEAAYNLSREFKSTHTHIDWRRIIATRHVMVHDYDTIDDAILWQIIRENVPELRAQVSQLLESLPE